MRLAYFDCASGIAGDMMLAALVDAGADLAAIQAGVASLGLPGVRLVSAEVHRKGFRGLKIDVQHEPEHKHRHLHHITEMIDAGRLTPRAKELAKKIFTRLGEAEAKVHGVEIRKVHFHEVGAVDSIADIVGTAIGLDLLGIERIEASPVPTGTAVSSTLPTGAAAFLHPRRANCSKEFRLPPSNVEAELTTPTGAAILAALGCCVRSAAGNDGAKNRLRRRDPRFRTVNRICCGFSSARRRAARPTTETLCLLETNLDDVSGEVIGYCSTKLLESGALDVFTTSIQMKKNRPGVLLGVLCQPGDADRLETIIFRETGTLGVRRSDSSHAANCRASRIKCKRHGARSTENWPRCPTARQSFSPEYEACRKIAAEKNVPVREVYDAAKKAFTSSASKSGG